MKIPTACTLCPRACKADRAARRGLCGGGARVRVARAALHFGEEPCISGTCGSGTVFFSGCALQCVYCQNYQISAENFGKEISTQALADIFLRLQEAGAHNINLVTAGHYAPWVAEALALARPALTLPVVYNTSGYETPETLAIINADVYLTDVKYADAQLARQYSNAADYPAAAGRVLRFMLAQTGAPCYDAQGLLTRGVLVRHLALPGHLADSLAVLRYLAAFERGSFRLSLMSQYTPTPAVCGDKLLGRRLSTYEYRRLLDEAVTLGFTDAYMQQRESATPEQTPAFDLTGV